MSEDTLPESQLSKFTVKKLVESGYALKRVELPEDINDVVLERSVDGRYVQMCIYREVGEHEHWSYRLKLEQLSHLVWHYRHRDTSRGVDMEKYEGIVPYLQACVIFCLRQDMKHEQE